MVALFISLVRKSVFNDSDNAASAIDCVMAVSADDVVATKTRPVV